MRSLGHCGGVVLSSALFVACGVPVSDSKYEVDWERPLRFERVVDAVSGGSALCDECLRDICPNEIDACAGTVACTELTVCMSDKRSPAGQTLCASEQGDVPLDAVSASAGVRDCRVGCKSDCSVGTDFGCVRSYHAPRPQKPTATVRQSFTSLCGMGAVQRANVEFCNPEGDCPVQAVTDVSGTYTARVPVRPNPPLAGWLGFRRVTAAELAKPHRLERNIPIWSDQVESTVLMSKDCAEEYFPGLRAEVASVVWDEVVIVQAFDCQLAGAVGVELSVLSAPTAPVLYPHVEGTGVVYSDDSSQQSAGGVILVLGLPPGEHEIVAMESTSGGVIAKGYLDVTGEELIMYSLLPNPE